MRRKRVESRGIEANLSLKFPSIPCMRRNWSMTATTVPSREGEGCCSLYRTWHRACVGGLIERQRPLRKGKKIKIGRKRKHLGVLDILSALNTHLRNGKTPWMRFTISVQTSEPERAEHVSDCGWEPRSNGGWIKAWKQCTVPCVSESQICSANASSFLFWKCSSDVWRKTENVGRGGLGGDKTNSN